MTAFGGGALDGLWRALAPTFACFFLRVPPLLLRRLHGVQPRSGSLASQLQTDERSQEESRGAPGRDSLFLIRWLGLASFLARLPSASTRRSRLRSYELAFWPSFAVLAVLAARFQRGKRILTRLVSSYLSVSPSPSPSLSPFALARLAGQELVTVQNASGIKDAAVVAVAAVAAESVRSQLTSS